MVLLFYLFLCCLNLVEVDGNMVPHLGKRVSVYGSLQILDRSDIWIREWKRRKGKRGSRSPGQISGGAGGGCTVRANEQGRAGRE